MSQPNTDWSSWNSSLMAPRIITIALAVSSVLYAGLMLGEFIPAGPVGPLTYVIPGFGLLMLPVAFAIPRFVPFPPISSPTKETEGVFAAEVVLADPADAREKYVGAVMTSFILRSALSESTAIFALVAFMVGGTPLPICIGLCGVSTLATLTSFPRTGDWKMRAETKLGARFPEE